MAFSRPDLPLRTARRPTWARRLTVLVALLLLGAGVSNRHDAQRHHSLDKGWQSSARYPGASHPNAAHHLEPSDLVVEPGCGACMLSLQSVAVAAAPTALPVVLVLESENQASPRALATGAVVSLAPSRAPPASFLA